MHERTEDSLIEGIAPKKIAHVTPVLTKEFKPWHKPRKQWIRQQQWVKETEALISSLRLQGRPLRYLSLPGEDMLDIRVLAAFCKEKGLKLKCLGYDESARDRTSQTEVNISRNEVSANIEPNSVIIADNISVLSNKKSQGFKYVRDNGPFDVINLDLCGSISCITFPDNHQVLYNLCEFQVNHSKDDWLLFLTTRAEYEQVNTEHLPGYLKCLKDNAEEFSFFGKKLKEISACDILRYNGSQDFGNLFEDCTGQRFVKFFAVGFGKWLLQLMKNAKERWIVEMLNCYWYRVEDNQRSDSFPNMLSLAFRFSPGHVTLEDRSGLASGNPEPKKINEQDLVLAILTQTDGLVDLDKMIDGDSVKWGHFTEESASLLRTARYSIDGYSDWAESKRIRF